MKIMVINNNCCSDNAADNDHMSVTLMADSAFLRNRQPYFIPDHAPRFGALPVVAFRVGRLGKCIARRFAHRYIDALSPAFIVLPLDDNNTPLDCHGMAAALDGGLLMGEWTTVDTSAQLPATAWSNADATGTITGDDLIVDPHDAVTFLSQYCTLKMGDIVCIPAAGNPPSPLVMNTRLQATVDNTTVLDHRIK